MRNKHHQCTLSLGCHTSPCRSDHSSLCSKLCYPVVGRKLASAPPCPSDYPWSRPHPLVLSSPCPRHELQPHRHSCPQMPQVHPCPGLEVAAPSAENSLPDGLRGPPLNGVSALVRAATCPHSLPGMPEPAFQLVSVFLHNAFTFSCTRCFTSSPFLLLIIHPCPHWKARSGQQDRAHCQAQSWNAAGTRQPTVRWTSE